MVRHAPRLTSSAPPSCTLVDSEHEGSRGRVEPWAPSPCAGAGRGQEGEGAASAGVRGPGFRKDPVELIRHADTPSCLVPSASPSPPGPPACPGLPPERVPREFWERYGYAVTRAPARASASEVMAVTCLRSEETAQSSQWAMPYIMRSARWADVRCLRLFTTVRSSVSRHAERAWSSMRCSRPFQGSRSLRQSPQRGRGARGSHRWRQRCCCSCWQRRSRRWRTPART